MLFEIECCTTRFTDDLRWYVFPAPLQHQLRILIFVIHRAIVDSTFSNFHRAASDTMQLKAISPIQGVPRACLGFGFTVVVVIVSSHLSSRNCLLHTSESSVLIFGELAPETSQAVQNPQTDRLVLTRQQASHGENIDTGQLFNRNLESALYHTCM